jgi:sporulation protein YlmC with PRC-barrel domain
VSRSAAGALLLAAAALSVSRLAPGAGWDLIRATAFLQTVVVDNHGERIGEVHELVLDVRNGRVHYAVLEVGGFLGINEKLIPYPVSALSPGPDDERVVLDVRPEQLADATGFERDHWPAWNDPVWDRAEGAGNPRFMRTQELIGRTVKDRDGETIGTLRDLVLNLARGEVRQALVEGKRERLVPFKQLEQPRPGRSQPLIVRADY